MFLITFRITGLTAKSVEFEREQQSVPRSVAEQRMLGMMECASSNF